MAVHLRQHSILLPSAAVLEKIALAARARARKQAYKALTAGVIQVVDGEARTAFAWAARLLNGYGQTIGRRAGCHGPP